jgi:uncharacterized membrane protein (DUF373 family)
MSEARRKPGTLREHYSDFHANWITLSFYERFEQIVALVLAWLIAVVIAVATWELAKEVLVLVGRGSLDPLDHRVFQVIFGQIMTLLIALEFKHSIVRVIAQQRSIIQVKTVLLIALLAIARKFIILDAAAPPQQVLALAAVVVALGTAYWLIRDSDVRRHATVKSVSQFQKGVSS